LSDERWLNNYDKGVPKTLVPYPQKTLVDYVDEAVKEHPDYPMVLFKKRKMSYAEIQKLTDEFAAALAAKGVKKGDRVALIMPNIPQAIICRWGAWKIGAILVHLNPTYTEPELEHALKDCGAETVVVMTMFYNQYQGEAGNRNKHQGLPAAAAQSLIHAGQREKRWSPHRIAKR
jgi:long-chain acyl-CoA synthetase